MPGDAKPPQESQLAADLLAHDADAGARRKGAGRILSLDLGRWSPLGEVLLVLVWAALSAFVFVELPAAHPPHVTAGLFTGLSGVIVLVVISFRRLADRRVRLGLQDASMALQAIEAVADPALSFLPLDSLLEEVLSRVSRFLEGDAAAVLLLGEEGRKVKTRVVHGAVGLLPVSANVGAGQGIISTVVEQRRGIIVSDLASEWPELARVPVGVTSLVAAPLIVRGEAIGVVEVATRLPHTFERRDLRLLQVVADRCAASIEQARLDEAERRSRLGAEHARLHLGLLARASLRLASALDSYDGALRSLVDVVVPDFADWFCIDLVGDDGQLHRLATGPSDPDPQGQPGPASHPHPEGARMVSLAMETGRAQVVMPKRAGPPHRGEPASSVGHDDPAPVPGVESMLIVPVRLRGVSFGAMSFVTGSGRRGYRRSDLDTAESLAERVGVVLERVLAWRQSRQAGEEAARHAARLQRLTEAALAVNAPLAEEEIVDLLATHAVRVLDARYVVVVAEVGGTGGTPGVEVMKPGQPAAVGDDTELSAAALAIAGDDSLPQRNPAVGFGHPGVGVTGPWLAVALKDDSGKARRIVVFGPEGSLYSEEDESILGLLCQIASVALQNARLYQAVEGNEHRLRAVIDSSPLAIAELDFNGQARWWNNAAAGLFGWHEGDEAAHSVPVRGSGARVVADLWDRTRAGEAILGVELGATGADGGALELSIATAPLRDHQGQVSGVLMVAGDVTERRKLLDQFHQAERLSAMARMAGGLAHDFNNLLTVILGSSQILLRRIDDRPDLQEEVAAIQRAGQRAAALTSQLLSIGQRRAVQPTDVDTNEVVLAMQPMLASVLGPDIELDIVPYAGPAHILADQADLERAVLNLAINSRDAMPKGGRLRVEVIAAGQQGPDKQAKLYGLVVSDVGVGMDLETQEHCFEPFFTTKGLARGTGLGLASVHAFVTQVGGQVTVDSSPGKGTTITLWFPAEGTLSARPEAGLASAARAGECLLVVEDEPELRRLVERELTGRGYQVRVTANGVEALRIIQDNSRHFDLVASDVVMPGMSGIELARMLMTVAPEVPVLLMSGHVEDDGSSESFPRGIDFLAKPFTPDELAVAVRRAIDRRTERPLPTGT